MACWVKCLVFVESENRRMSNHEESKPRGEAGTSMDRWPAGRLARSLVLPMRRIAGAGGRFAGTPVNRFLSLLRKSSARPSPKSGSPEKRRPQDVKKRLQRAFDLCNDEMLIRAARELIDALPLERTERLALDVADFARNAPEFARKQFAAALQAEIRKKMAETEGGPLGFVADSTRLLMGFIAAGWNDCVENIESCYPGQAAESAHVLALLGEREKWSYRLDPACDLFKQALRSPGCDPSVHFYLAEALEFLSDDKAAIQEINKGLSCFTDEELFLRNPGRMTMLAGPKMRLGDIVGGWEAQQKRRDRFVLDGNTPREVWAGPRKRCERILVFGEAGIGDELKYASCFEELQSVVPNVVVTADPRLVPIFERSFPQITFIGEKRQKKLEAWRGERLRKEATKLNRAITLELFSLLTAFEQYVLSGDLPLHFRRSRAAFCKSSKGYLEADPARRGLWEQRLGSLGPGLKIGLSWRSQVARNKTVRRAQHYFSLEQMLPLLNLEGVHFVNLQYDGADRELEDFENEHGVAVHRWDDIDIDDDLEGVAALMKELDLVITPHNMVKELAGALGVPTLFLVPTGQAWVRWRADPQTAADVWHASVRHLQATNIGDEVEVIEKARARVEELITDDMRRRWRQARAGRHRVAQQGPVAPQEPVEGQERDGNTAPCHINGAGETFNLCGQAHFPDRASWEAELARRELAFEQRSNAIFEGLEQPPNPEGVLIVFGQSHKQLSLTLLAAHGLLKRNWATVSLDETPFHFGRIANPQVEFFHHLLEKQEGLDKRLFRVRGVPEGLHFDWEIDLPQQVCRAEGMNFYGTIANRLGKEFRRYPSDLSEPKVRARFDVLLRTCDAALMVCLEAERRLAGQGMQVRFTGYEQDYPPTGVFKIYCSERGYRHGIEFVEIVQSYEKYFRGGVLGLVTAVDCQNVTRHGLGSAWTLRADQFDEWFRLKRGDPEVAARCRKWATIDRAARKEISPQGKMVIERLEQHRQAGGKIGCLYGSVPYDFGHPGLDNGPAHFDRRDWLNHTVKTIAGTNSLLLIKPHPDEARTEQIGIPTQYFVEMLDHAPPGNVIILGHRWLNNSDLVPYLDFGLVWRGSVAVELALLGVPIVACNPRSMCEQVLDLQIPKDRSDYENMLRNPATIVMTDETRERAATVFEFYGSEVMIPYPFGLIPQKRKDAGVPVWSEAALRDYLAGGHASIDEMCRRIIS